MEETRGITVKVRESLHGKAKQEAEEKEQTMSQFIETVLQYYFEKGADKEMAIGKRTLAFQVSEEFFTEVQDYVRGNGLKLKDFGIAAMKKMMEDAAQSAPPTNAPTEAAATEVAATDEDAADSRETA